MSCARLGRVRLCLELLELFPLLATRLLRRYQGSLAARVEVRTVYIGNQGPNTGYWAGQ
jgi:hypothetical protein